MNSDPCCGVPVQCLRADDECKHREAHHADRGLYHPLASADPPGPANVGMGFIRGSDTHLCWTCGKQVVTDGHKCPEQPAESGGSKLKGNHYYRVAVSDPISGEVPPYTAECADIIEALGMTFNEGEAFKAIWRLAAGRTLGLKKNDPQYDADKAAHYGARIAVQVARNSGAKP